MFGLFEKKKSYRFKEPESTACIMCGHVMSRERPVLFASHDPEGDWQFMCGADAHHEADAKVVSLAQAAALDPTLNDLYEMPRGVGAERGSVGSGWRPFKLTR